MATERPPAGRPAIQESLLEVAAQLESAARAGGQSLAHAAVRAATLAVEHRLGLLTGPHGLEAEVAEHEPRLLRALDNLEAELARLLVAFWDAGETLDRGALAFRLRELARQVRAASSDEYDIIYESLTAPSALD